MKEVEIRFKVMESEYSSVLELLKQRCIVSESIQDDQYYCDKVYADTNTTNKCPYVLRIRQSDIRNVLTYKSFVDGGTSWIEEETEISNVDSMRKILQYLGNTEYLRIKKERKSGKYGNIEVNLDRIKDLGVFVELELMHDDVEFAKTELRNFLSEELQCRNAEVVDRGYVQLMEDYLSNKKQASDG